MIQRLAILGFGDIEVAPKVAATIANFFADRPIEIRCWDENSEACDAMYRVLRVFLKQRELKYPVTQPSLDHSLDKADALIQIGDPELATTSRPLLPVFWLENGPNRALDSHKFQALRWINQEDDPLEFMQEHQNPELLAWLNSF